MNLILFLLIVLFIFYKIFNKNDKIKINPISVFKKISEIDSSDLSYNSFTIQKKDGTSRYIDSPNENLKFIQKQILTILEKNIILPGYITGFRKKFSIKLNAKKHIGKKVVINLDIKDFFTNVTVDKLKSRLEFLKIDAEIISKIEKLCFYRGSLPQGAPTSPFLANFIFIPVDVAIINLAKKFDNNITYTRYADNITISSDVSKISNLIRLISDGIVPKFGYVIKKEKVNLTRSHTRQTVTGIVVNEKVNMPRQKYMKLRAKIHSYLTKGTGNPQEIAGHLSFLYLLDKEKYKTLKGYYKNKFPDNSDFIRIFPTKKKK